jgi:hypothetical protein
MQCLYSRVASIISSVCSGDDGEISSESKTRLSLVCECLKSDLGLQVYLSVLSNSVLTCSYDSGIGAIFLPVHFSANEVSHSRHSQITCIGHICDSASS